MELSQLRSFVAVADEMHVGRAAGRLHLAQPTLSRQIAALERSVGVELFSRARRSLQLTSAGEIFLTSARDILARAEHATRDANRAARGEVGTIRIGFVQSATYAAIPRLIGMFRSTCPDVEINARSMTTLRQLQALRDGDLDVGVLRPQQPASGQPELQMQILSRDVLTAVLPAEHPLAKRKRVALSALADERFVLYPDEEGSTGHQMILDYCAQAGYRPRIVQHAADAQTILALVAGGLGVSLLLSPTPPIDPSLIAYRHVSDKLPTWETALAWSANNSSTTLARFLAATAENPPP